MGQRDMKSTGLRAGDETNMATWSRKIISRPYIPRKEEKDGTRPVRHSMIFPFSSFSKRQVPPWPFGFKFQLRIFAEHGHPVGEVWNETFVLERILMATDEGQLVDGFRVGVRCLGFIGVLNNLRTQHGRDLVDV